MRDQDADRSRIRNILSEGGDSTVTHLVSITGPIQTLHVHINAAVPITEQLASAIGSTKSEERERTRKLEDIRTLIETVPHGNRKLLSYLRREFGGTPAELLPSADLERILCWARSFPRPVA